eukprot:CAMPEP_0198308960 /NCGR_PEP_ID=MMETSP1450-20131203/1448_1 /TAXON_ID=753684 ORGANISM="Madagascaria erythrocladiodes, Strain CCMP3234" /NCGR_SAMPLE_ID=MMETSP1450 /ASSEMBLY_ACC=CAM_ASM_001115 /LENGTH=299 /DNA_ID=CAMNT_0044011679 /DNA_START=40 /DNA_END=935 /DNA_ORIENTATION=-
MVSPVVAHFASAAAELLAAPVKFFAEILAYFISKAPVTHTTGLVVVTGSARGFGKGIVASLTTAGYTVIAGVRKEADGEALKGQVPGLKYYVLLDVGKPESVAAAVPAVQKIADESGLALVGLVNNAGILPVQALQLMTEEDMESVLNVNLKGPTRTIQAFLPMLRASKGRIINVSSVGSMVPLPFVAMYQAAKAGEDQMSRVLSAEVSEFGVKVITVCPGGIDTDMASTDGRWMASKRTDVAEEQVTAYDAHLQRMSKFDPPYKVSPLELADMTVTHAMQSERPFPCYFWGYDSVVAR